MQGDEMNEIVSKYFRALPGNSGVSTARLYVMRLFFVLMFVTLGRKSWIEVFAHSGEWDPLHGVAFSFWAAYSTLLLLGLS
jgi:hypothetical protein